MSSVGELKREAKPAYVQFETRAIEDKAASVKAGRYVGKDVDYAIITPSYSKDRLYFKMTDFFAMNEQQVRQESMPKEWADLYRKQYDMWKSGQDIPVEGTPIKGWPVLSPAQCETLLRMNVRTVEDLAGINDEGMRQIGMGGVDLKNKANAWLAQAHDKGPATMEIATLKRENETLKISVDSLTVKVEALLRVAKAQEESGQAPQTESSTPITSSDIFEDDKPRGRKR